jgi:uncharacterized iron-regulated membrane protein
MVGFWIALPLAVVSLTGIYLGFPQQGRDVLAALAPMSPPQRGGLATPLLQPTALSVDQALDAAAKTMPDAVPAAIFMPNLQNKAWRVELRLPGMDEAQTLMVDDSSGTVSRAGRRLSGDRVAAWIRRIHEGSHAGQLWRTVVFLCGLAPPVLGFTGVIIWLQRRSRKKTLERRHVLPRLGPAE